MDLVLEVIFDVKKGAAAFAKRLDKTHETHSKPKVPNFGLGPLQIDRATPIT